MIACFSATPRHIPSAQRNISSGALLLPARRTKPRRAALLPAMACAFDASPDLLKAAKHTVDNYVRSGMVIGLGPGRASGLATQHLGRRLREGSLQDIVGIPMSVSSASKAAKAGIPLDNFQDNLQSIVKTSGNLAFIIPENQYTKDFDGSIPVLVNPGNWMETAEEIDDMFLGDAEVWRRPTSGPADPVGGDFPLVTKGHHILDVIFTSPILNLAQVEESLDQIDGVVDHGVISGIRCTAIIASNSGIVTVDNLSKLRT